MQDIRIRTFYIILFRLMGILYFFKLLFTTISTPFLIQITGSYGLHGFSPFIKSVLIVLVILLFWMIFYFIVFRTQVLVDFILKYNKLENNQLLDFKENSSIILSSSILLGVILFNHSIEGFLQNVLKLLFVEDVMSKDENMIEGAQNGTLSHLFYIFKLEQIYANISSVIYVVVTFILIVKPTLFAKRLKLEIEDGDKHEPQ